MRARGRSLSRLSWFFLCSLLFDRKPLTRELRVSKILEDRTATLKILSFRRVCNGKINNRSNDPRICPRSGRIVVEDRARFGIQFKRSSPIQSSQDRTFRRVRPTSNGIESFKISGTRYRFLISDIFKVNTDFVR